MTFDPLSAISLGVELVGRPLAEWARGDEVQRLFARLDTELDAAAGLSAFSLDPLRRDETFLGELARYSQSGELNREAMVESIRPFVGGDEVSSRETADDIVSIIQQVMILAFRSDREAMRFGFTRVEAQLSATQARFLTLDWAPDRVHARLEELAAAHPAEAARLETSLSSDPAASIRGLVRHPPQWALEGSSLMWDIVGVICDSYALWEEAKEAFYRGSEVAGADRPCLLAKAAMASHVAGDLDGYRDFLARAQDIEGSHPVVILAAVRSVDADPAHQLEMLSGTESEDPRVGASIATTRAMCLIRLGDLDAAQGECDRATALDPLSAQVRELAIPAPPGRPTWSTTPMMLRRSRR